MWKQKPVCFCLHGGFSGRFHNLLFKFQCLNATATLDCYDGDILTFPSATVSARVTAGWRWSDVALCDDDNT